MTTELYQFLAVTIFTILGIVFILAFRKRDLPKCINVPASKCHNDFKAIMGCIEDSTTSDQLEKLENISRTFFKLHYKMEDDNSEVICYYTSLQNTIDNKKSEINAVTEVW